MTSTSRTTLFWRLFRIVALSQGTNEAERLQCLVEHVKLLRKQRLLPPDHPLSVAVAQSCAWSSLVPIVLEVAASRLHSECSATSEFLALPEDIHRAIFAHGPKYALCLCRYTCVLAFSLPKSVTVAVEARPLLHCMPQLEALRFKRPDSGLMPLAALTMLPALPRLTSLTLRSCRVWDAGLACISSLTGLEALDIGECCVSSDGLRHMSALTRLTSLNLDARVGPGGALQLSALHTLASLRALSLRRTGTNGAALAALGALSRLTLLCLSHNPGISTLDGLAPLRQLRELDLSYTDVSGGALACLAGCTGLRSLDLQHCSRVCNRGMLAVARLSALTHLNLHATAVTDAGVAHLRDLRRLESLVLCLTKVTHVGIAHLTGLRALALLDYRGTFVYPAKRVCGGSDVVGALRELRRMGPLAGVVT